MHQIPRKDKSRELTEELHEAEMDFPRTVLYRHTHCRRRAKPADMTPALAVKGISAPRSPTASVASLQKLRVF